MSCMANMVSGKSRSEQASEAGASGGVLRAAHFEPRTPLTHRRRRPPRRAASPRLATRATHEPTRACTVCTAGTARATHHMTPARSLLAEAGSTHYEQSKADPTRSTSEGKSEGGAAPAPVASRTSHREPHCCPRTPPPARALPRPACHTLHARPRRTLARPPRMPRDATQALLSRPSLVRRVRLAQVPQTDWETSSRSSLAKASSWMPLR